MSFALQNLLSFRSWNLFHISAFMPIPSCCYYYCFIVNLKVSNGDASRGSFIVHYCFCYLGVLFFYMKLTIVLLRSVNNCDEILVRIALSLWMAFGKIVIFTIFTFILFMQELGRPFHFMISSSLLFFRDLMCLLYRSFIYFVRVPP